MRRLRDMLILLATVAAVVGPAVAIGLATGAAVLVNPSTAQANPQGVINDCAKDGKLDHQYSLGDLKKAEQQLPSDVDEYTNCRDVINQAEVAASGGHSKGSTHGALSGAGTGSGGGGGNAAASPSDVKALAKAAKQAGGQAPTLSLGGESVTPGSPGVLKSAGHRQLASHTGAARADRGRPSSPRPAAALRSRAGSPRSPVRRYASSAASVALGGAFAAIAFVAKGGSDLATLTWVELALVIGGGLVVVAAALHGRQGAFDGGFALLAFVALAALTALSVLWSIAPDLTWIEANRTFAYLVVFAAGIALARAAPDGWAVLLRAILVAVTVVVGYALPVARLPRLARRRTSCTPASRSPTATGTRWASLRRSASRRPSGWARAARATRPPTRSRTRCSACSSSRCSSPTRAAR